MTEPHVGYSKDQIAQAVLDTELDTTPANAVVIDAVAQFDWELSKRSDHPDATSVGGAAEGAAPPPFGPSAKYQ